MCANTTGFLTKSDFRESKMAETNSNAVFYVYVHRRQTDGKIFYVGKGNGRRAYVKRRNPFWTSVANKHGYTVHIIENGLAEAEAFELECFLIAEIGRENLCNLTDGGEGAAGRVMTEEEKAMRSRIISQSWANDEIRKRHSEILRGMKRTEESKRKIAAAKIGNKNALGNSHSEEAKKKMSEALKGKYVGSLHFASMPVRCVETGKVFDCAREAAEWLKSIGFEKAAKSMISDVCRKTRKSGYGYRWEYA